MSHKSYRKREVVSIAIELEGLVKAAAQPIQPGEGVTRQMRRAWRALGEPNWWRFRAAWYGQAHEGWAVGVVDDLRHRYARWEARREEARAHEHADAVAVLDALRAQYAEADPDFYREQIAAIDAALGASGGKGAAMGSVAGGE